MYYDKRDSEKVKPVSSFARISRSDLAQYRTCRDGSSGVLSKYHYSPCFLLRQSLALLLVTGLMAVFYFMHLLDPLERRT